jgi:capsular exopolysaccharide synthesis family protein
MEKIKQALERASVARSSTHVGDQRSKFIRQSPSPDTSKIKYTKTRSVKVSKDEMNKKRVIIGESNDLVSDQYKVLRTHTLQRLKSNQWNLLAVTGPDEGCGKTLTSINLAICLAKDVNHSVLLVDLDLRRPKVHSYFYNNEQAGISDYLDEGKDLSEILFTPEIERLVILPGNKSLANSSEMLSSPKMVKLVDELKNRYPDRIVIFDMPPLLSCDDVIAFSPYFDAVMLVIEEGATKKDDLKRSYELLKDSNIIGTVLNKSKSMDNLNNYY